jgi:pyrroloquinoline quinone (PQQ) biosynthesis protein C
VAVPSKQIEFREDHSSLSEFVDEISSWLSMDAADVDALSTGARARILAAVNDLNARAAAEPAALHCQQLLLSRIYAVSMQLPHGPTAEGSIVIYEIMRALERATIVAEDAYIGADQFVGMPEDGARFVFWLKGIARSHRVFKHPYYAEFINHDADEADLRTYVIQESLVDGRFDDLLAMMQVGTSGAAKMEIASNFWDEMGNGNPHEVHTHLFTKIYEAFGIVADELEGAMTATDLLAGNLAVLLCRYRHLYPEAVGFLGMTEWLVPGRFQHVVRAWKRLGLPDVGITYHRLHITIDSKHAAGWFHNIVEPACKSERMRHGIARGTFWRLNSSARLLDERMDGVYASRPPATSLT